MKDLEIWLENLHFPEIFVEFFGVVVLANVCKILCLLFTGRKLHYRVSGSDKQMLCASCAKYSGWILSTKPVDLLFVIYMYIFYRR